MTTAFVKIVTQIAPVDSAIVAAAGEASVDVDAAEAMRGAALGVPVTTVIAIPVLGMFGTTCTR